MVGRDAVSRALPCKQVPGGFGKRPSATTSGREELAGQNKKRQRPRRPGCLKSRGGAPKGERPTLLDARRLASACGSAPSIRQRVPLHPSAYRRSAPSRVEGGILQSSEAFRFARRMKHVLGEFE